MAARRRASLIIVLVGATALSVIYYFHFDIVHFLQCFKSTVYIIWSGLWAAYHTAMLMLEIYYYKDNGAEYLIYLTHWTYMVLSGACIADLFFLPGPLAPQEGTSRTQIRLGGCTD